MKRISIKYWLIFGITLFLISMSGCGSKNLPYYGAFLKKGNDFVVIPEMELLNLPSLNELQDAPSIEDSMPIIALWKQNTNIDYLALYSVDPRQELQFTANPQDDGVYYIRPSQPLSSGYYCLVQGDPISAFLPGWCFEIISETDSSSTDNETVMGNGEVIEVTKEISGIDAVSLESIGEMEIIQGDDESLVVKAESNLIEYLTFDTSGGNLAIGVKPGYNLNPKKSILYTLTVKELNRIAMSGIAKVSVPSLTSGQLEVDASGDNRLKINELRADILNIEVSGTSWAEIAGQVGRIELDASGASEFKGADLESQLATVDASGAANVSIWVIERLEVDAAGMGTVAYFGNPEVDASTSGDGSVSRKETK